MKDHHVEKKRPAGDSRTVTVTSKFSEADLAKIRPKLAVAKKSLSTFVRDAVLGAEVHPRAEVPAINAAQWRELSRVAANLNQVAHHCNSGGWHAGLPRVLEAVEATQAVLAQVRAALLGSEGGTVG